MRILFFMVMRKAVTTDEAAAPVERKKDIDSVDFEKKLEESLKNL